MKVRGRTAARLAWIVWACAACPAAAQTLPSEPIAFADGHVTVSGDVSATFGCELASPEYLCRHDQGFFNYTDYSHSALRELRIDGSAAVKAGPHFTFLTEVRTYNFSEVQPYALYVRIRPWVARDFDIQVGRVPPTFGAFTRRTYANDNPLIGYPLAFQYQTTMRSDALPASTDELLAKRSTGWLVRYSVGERAPVQGVPLVTAFRWDTGVQAHAVMGIVNVTGSVTNGTVSRPLFHDDNDGRQIATRVELRPMNGLVAGTSFARGPFVSSAATRAALGGETVGGPYTQTAWGGDLEYSRGYYLIRAETVWTEWRLPIAPTPPRQLPIAEPLGALATYVEGRYKLRPGLYIAARYDHLGFSDLEGTAAALPWDAPVTRVEVGGGYSLQRNLVLKLSYQRNVRDGGVLLQHASFISAQLVYWF
ncbi:MAG TPA: hypothetical protein VKE51_28815 [Vicinamibacterales bacterium]|nr:hypothetical protein [Vicinamibacterales bacterium]